MTIPRRVQGVMGSTTFTGNLGIYKNSENWFDEDMNVWI